ncbi:MAG: DUF1622 domain-containing protein [Ardenticatenaceae bacterium]|nr:DUF1622 domain-containing protein [Ardenticatenaceae bacterium]
MIEIVTPLAEWCAALIEALGVVLISGIAIYALLAAVWQRYTDSSTADIYPATRQRLGRGILLGLEFLVAADIIHTAAVDFNIQTVAVLATIVIIRTFLSFTLEVELTGRWPWQEGKN